MQQSSIFQFSFFIYQHDRALNVMTGYRPITTLSGKFKLPRKWFIPNSSKSNSRTRYSLFLTNNRHFSLSLLLLPVLNTLNLVLNHDVTFYCILLVILYYANIFFLKIINIMFNLHLSFSACLVLYFFLFGTDLFTRGFHY